MTTKTQSITIDPEFAALIPPLSPEEREQLEKNLLQDGCREPLVVWNGTLVDGHNRHEICTRNGIPFEVREMEFSSRETALLWIEENQIGRRNISDDQRSVIADSIRERRSKAAVAAAAAIGGKSGGKGRPKIDSDSDALTEPLTSKPKTDTRAAVAKEMKVPERKLRAVAEVKKAAPEMIAKVRAGDMTLLQAKREIKEQQREARREANRAKVEEAESPLEIVEAGAKFATIVIDPPWDWGDEGDQDQLGRARPDYATMSLEQLCELPVDNLADDDCHIYLWITNRSLPKGFRLLTEWGFRYITAITWAKPHFGMGNYFRGQTEHILFGVKGSQPLKRKDASTLFSAPRGKGGHSSKPIEFLEFVETCSPGPYLEMFSRSHRDGWTTWGEGE
jgi:N6-adenosine-specific RNA methylase IME4